MDIPIIIISYNNYKYVKNTLRQINTINPRYYKNIIIMDNCSTCTKTKRFLEEIDVNVIFNESNNGPWINDAVNKGLYDKLPNKFIITDPDLEFNKNLPSNFIDILSDLSDQYGCSKIGFALDIKDYDKMFQYIYFQNQTIYEWENKFWNTRIDNSNYEIYKADIDTTFCLINKSNYNYNYNNKSDSDSDCIRIAGDFLAKHIPWYTNNTICNIYCLNTSVYNTNSSISTINKLVKQFTYDNYDIVRKNNETFFINKFQKNRNFFQNETFEVLDKFLNKNKTFIDLGAWVGATAMYSSRMSKNVICVEADIDSYKDLKMNMENNCENNYNIINKAIYHINNTAIKFGKNRFLINSDINDGTSTILNTNGEYSYISTITINKIIEDYNINYEDISIINVDIEGGEENILSDLYNIHKEYNIPIYISFHYTWWNNKDLGRFSFLNNEMKNAIITDPFTSILFK